MKIKPAVKLDLGEMCKLRLLFFVSRENLIAYLQTRSLAKYVFRFRLLRIRFFLLLPTVNTRFHGDSK
jgi:hypothetical protein